MEFCSIALLPRGDYQQVHDELDLTFNVVFLHM
jgi:hypothetical protein